MPGFRRRKDKSQTTALDASWILLSDEVQQENVVDKQAESFNIPTGYVAKSQQVHIISSPDPSNSQEHHDQASRRNVDEMAFQEQAKVPQISHPHIVTQYSPAKARNKPRYSKQHSRMWVEDSPGPGPSTAAEHENDDDQQLPVKSQLEIEEQQADTNPFVTAPQGYPFSIFRVDKTPTASPGNAAPPLPPWRYLSSSYSPRNGSV